MAELATRNTLALALYEAMGIAAPTSKGKFGDGGDLDGVVSTLADLGITNGVGNGQYGGAATTTRGQAFTMIARALGLADANTSIADASKALVDAGIVKGYGGDPNNLGINDPLQADHLGLLMDRLRPELSKTRIGEDKTVGEGILDTADELREDQMAQTDPTLAAFLASQGIRRGEIDDEIALRTDLFNEDARRRSEAYQRATDLAMDGIGTDFENRGLYRSAARMAQQGERRQQLGFQQEEEQYAAQRSYEAGIRALEQERSALDRETTQSKIASGVESAADGIESMYE